MKMTVNQVDSLTDEDVERLFCPQVYFSDEGYGSYTYFRMLKDKSVSSEVMIALSIRSQSIAGFLDSGEPIHMSKLVSEHDSDEKDEDDFDVMINKMITDGQWCENDPSWLCVRMVFTYALDGKWHTVKVKVNCELEDHANYKSVPWDVILPWSKPSQYSLLPELVRAVFVMELAKFWSGEFVSPCLIHFVGATKIWNADNGCLPGKCHATLSAYLGEQVSDTQFSGGFLKLFLKNALYLNRTLRYLSSFPTSRSTVRHRDKSI